MAKSSATEHRHQAHTLVDLLPAEKTPVPHVRFWNVGLGVDFHTLT
jgi:hypothetical protein